MCSSVRPVWNHKERQSKQRTQASGPLATLRLPHSEMRSLLHWNQPREVEFFLRSRPRSHRFRTRAGVLSGSAKAHTVQLGGERSESVVQRLRTTDRKISERKTSVGAFLHHLERARRRANLANEVLVVCGERSLALDLRAANVRQPLRTRSKDTIE